MTDRGYSLTNHGGRTWTTENLRQAWKFRRLIPKMAVNTVRAKSGARVLRGVEFAITYTCNFACSHCLRDNLIDEERTELSADEIVETARAIESLGGIFINYTGGEALVRKDIDEIIERTARIPGLFVSLASNGWLLTPTRLREVKRLGVSMLALSLDGPTAEIHDGFRKRTGSFERVIEAARAAKSEGIDVWFTGVVRNDLALGGHLEALTELARREGCLLTLNLPYDVGGWHGRDEDIRLTPEAHALYVEMLKKPWVRWEGSSNWDCEGCPAGVEKLYFTPYGDVFPCGAIHHNYGNVREKPLSEIYTRMGLESDFGHCRKGCLVAEEPHRLAALTHSESRTDTVPVTFEQRAKLSAITAGNS